MQLAPSSSSRRDKIRVSSRETSGCSVDNFWSSCRPSKLHHCVRSIPSVCTVGTSSSGCCAGKHQAPALTTFCRAIANPGDVRKSLVFCASIQLHQHPERTHGRFSLAASVEGVGQVHSQHRFASLRAQAFGHGQRAAPSNNRIKLTHQTDIGFAYAKPPPVWRAAYAWC